MSNYLSGDNIAEKHLHTEVQRVAGIKVIILFETIYLIACYIEEPRQKYRTGTVSNRVLGVGKRFKLVLMDLRLGRKP